MNHHIFRVFWPALLSILTLQAFAQTPSPSPHRKKITLKDLKVVHRQASGNDMKQLAKPERKEKISWEKVIVGKQQLNGAQLVGLPETSVWKRIGFNQGDVILKIAGEDVGSETQLDKALKKLDKSTSVDFKILHDNQVMIIDYSVKW